MLASNRISKLQRDKAGPQSAGSRPKSAGGGRPRSARNPRPTSASGAGQTASSAASSKPTSVLPDSGNPSLSESLERQSPDQIRSSNGDLLEQKYQADSSLDDDPIQESSQANNPDESDVVNAESFQRSDPSIFTASSHKLPEQSTSSFQNNRKEPTAPTGKQKRLASGARRKSQSAAKRRPKSASGQRRGSTSSQMRPARRMEDKYARRVNKEEVKQAKKPNLEGDWMTKVKSLWIMFVMSFVPKVLTAIGLIICMLGIIMMGIGSNVEANYPQGKAVGGVMFFLGFVSVVLGLIALKIRRKEKKKMRGLATQQAREKYAMNGVSNGEISIIGSDIDFDRVHHLRRKSSFTVIETEESGFTNLAAIVDDYHLPGSPYRQKRRESIEATMKQMSPRQKEEPEILVVPNPPLDLNPPRNKSHGGKNVKKSKGSLAKKPTLTDIPEVTVTEPSPRKNLSEGSSPRNADSSQESSKKRYEDDTFPAQSPKSPRKTRDSLPKNSPVSDRKEAIAVESDKTIMNNSLRDEKSSPPIQNDPMTNQEDDSWEESRDELGSSQNKKNEEKDRLEREVQKGKHNTAYMNMGFNEGDILPEDLD